MPPSDASHCVSTLVCLPAVFASTPQPLNTLKYTLLTHSSHPLSASTFTRFNASTKPSLTSILSIFPHINPINLPALLTPTIHSHFNLINLPKHPHSTHTHTTIFFNLDLILYFRRQNLVL